MRAVIRKWGNSLALRIPSGLAEDAALREGSEVEVAVDAGRLVIEPIAIPELSLDALLAAITPANLHGEHDPGPSHGAEGW